MMAQPENSNPDGPENKRKTQKRKQKDEGSAETVRNEDDISMSKKIVPSFPSQNKFLKKVKTLRSSKTVLKNTIMRKFTKKVKTGSKKTKEIGNPVSDETLKITDVAVTVDAAPVDSETTSLNSEQIGEEPSPMITNTNSSTCKPQSQSDETDNAILENTDNSTSKSKESSIAETSVVQVPPLESDLKNSDLSSSSGTKQKNIIEDSERFDLNDKKSDAKYGESCEEPNVLSDDCKESKDNQTMSNKKRMVSSDAEYGETSGSEPKSITDNCKESNDQTIRNRHISSQNDVTSNPKLCESSEGPKAITDNCNESNDQTICNNTSIVSSDPKYCEPSQTDKESNDQTISNRQNSSQNDVTSNPKFCKPSEEPKVMPDDCKESNDHTMSNKKKIVSSDTEYGDPSGSEPKAITDNFKENNDQTISNNKSIVSSDPKYCKPSQTDNCKENNDQTISNNKSIVSSDPKYCKPSQTDNCKENNDQTISNNKSIVSSDPKYCKPSQTDNFKENNDQTLSNRQNSSQNDVTSNLLADFETCQPISKQNTLIQNQSFVNDSSQTLLIPAENSKEYKLNESDHPENSDQVTNSNLEHPDEVQPVINSNKESVGLLKGIPNKKMTPIKSLILTAALKEEDNKEPIPQTSKDFGLMQVPEIPGTSGSCIKDPVIFENDDMDITDSQLCLTEWFGDLLPENVHSKKSDSYLAKFKKAESDGTKIVNELITELSRLNKLLVHYKREIDSVWKRRKVSSVPSQQNTIKKRAPVQTVLGQFR